MNDIVSIDELRKKFNDKKSIEEWQGYAQAQNALIEKLQRELDFAVVQRKHLEQLLLQKQSLALPLVPEEVICLEQIARLKEDSTKRALTLEEVKRLDLLVKNLKLIREESTIVVNNTKQDLTENELVAIIQSTRDSE